MFIALDCNKIKCNGTIKKKRRNKFKLKINKAPYEKLNKMH